MNNVLKIIVQNTGKVALSLGVMVAADAAIKGIDAAVRKWEAGAPERAISKREKLELKKNKIERELKKLNFVITNHPSAVVKSDNVKS